MPAQTTTDNFLPDIRSRSSYLSRPIPSVSRRVYRSENEGSLISDFLPPQAVPSKSSPVPKEEALQNKTSLKARSSKKLLYALAPVLIILCGVGLMGLTGNRQQPQTLPPATHASLHAPVIPPPVEAFGLPARIKIPTINVDAAVEHMGLTAQGALDVPKGPADAAWYDQGPRPGEKGNSVISGHFGWKDGLPAVFDDLRKLQKGDMVYIEDEKGSITTFVVRDFRTFAPSEATAEVFNATDSTAHLNLITCNGQWSNAKKSYSQRLVVFADKV